MENCLTRPKKITLLNEQSYRIFLSHAPDGIGHNHQAIINDGHQDHSVFASFYPAATHPKSLVNEITAYLLAMALGLPIAPKAFIVLVKAGYLQSIDSRLAFPNQDDLIPLWCTCSIPGSSPKIHYNLKNVHENPVFIADISKWKHILDTVVFDEWLGNSDRNVGNLIRTGKHCYTLIDHEDIAIHRTWQADWLEPGRKIQNLLADILWADRGPADVKQVNEMMYFSESAMTANIQVLQELVYWWKLLLDNNELTALHRFIMKRATICPSLIAQRFGALL